MSGRLNEYLASLIGRPAVGPIGLDFGAEWVHLAQWQGAGDQRVPRAVASLPWTPREKPHERATQLRELIAKARDRQPFRRAPVVCAMPPEAVRLMVMGYQPSPDRSDEQILVNLVAERLQEPLERFVIDYIPMRTSGEKRGEKSALVAIARQENVAQQLDLIHAAGLEVAALEIEPVAIRRTVTWLADDEIRENSLIIHCSARDTHVSVLWGRRLVLYREIDFGESQLVDQLAKTLTLSRSSGLTMLRKYGFETETGELEQGDKPEAVEIAQMTSEILRPCFYALVDQINRALSYAASQTHGAPIQHVLLGGLARWPGTARLLAELLGTPVRTLDPLLALGTRCNSIPVLEGESEPDPSVALGCSLREVS